MNFASIPGQKEIKSQLIRSVAGQRVSHAQLFTGPEGCGSLALALAFARYVSCENRNGSDSCGICKSCVKYDKMIHPDLHFVFPVIKRKKENDAPERNKSYYYAQQSTKKDTEPVSDSYIEEWREFVGKNPFFTITKWLDAIEAGNSQGLIYSSEAGEIIRKLSLKTFESDYKIMIIWLPEKMHNTAANKLLKMIEEPPEKTLFLLVSEEPDKVLPTIISRCQLVRIPGFSGSDISKYLVSVRGAEEKKASEIAHVANGNLIKALELIDNEDSSLYNLDNFRKLMRFAWKRDIISMISWSEEISSIGREAQKSFILYSLRLMRENLMIHLGQMKNGLVFLSGEEAVFSGNFHPFIKKENIYSLNNEFSLAHSHIEANGNPKIIFLDLALRVTKLIR
jgi:DNA polymerase-3 subunit delta'